MSLGTLVLGGFCLERNSPASEEVIELEEIGELDRIFTHINAMLVAQK